MPYYQAREAVEITLAGIGAQTYPPHLMQVVIADDGSDPPLANLEAPDGIDLQIVHQEDRGFGAPRARNAGARAADGEIIVFADCDMVPEPAWVEAHARWHHVASDLLVLGFRRHVEFDGITATMVAAAARDGDLAPLFDGRPIQRPEWIEYHMSRTNELSSLDDDLFRIVTSGNMSLRTDWFEDLGGFDETFTQWGAEDTELGYRAFARGSVLVPDREALAWHQGLGTSPDETETASLELQRAKIAHLIAHRGFRRSVPGRSFTVPHVVVSIRGGAEPAAVLTESVERVLGNRFHDLVVELEHDHGHPHAAWLDRQFRPDPRVTVGAPRDVVSRWPGSGLFIEIPPGAEVRDYAIRRLVDLSGDAGVTEVPLDDGSSVTVAWGRAMQRAARLGGGVELAAELFGRGEIDWRDVGIRSPGDGAAAFGRGATAAVRRALNSPDSRIGKVWRQSRQVRSPADAARVGRWFAGAVKQRLTNRSMIALPPVPALAGTGGPGARSGEPTSDVALGANLATAGAAAARMLAASSRPVAVGGTLEDARSAAGGHLDVLVSSEPPSPALLEEASALDLPVVVVGAPGSSRPGLLAAPGAVDPRRANPTGWVYHATEPPVAVPTRSRLAVPPPAGVAVVAEHDLEVPPGSRAKLVPNVWDAIRHARCVVDAADLHDSQLDRADRLIELSCRGVPVVADDLDAGTSALLGDELAAVVAEPVPDDLHAREWRSVRQRRAALRRHSLSARVGQILHVAGVSARPEPSVSVVLATNRPDNLDRVIAAIDGQTYSNRQLVVALHGSAFPDGTARRLRGAVAGPIEVVSADGSMALGEVLNRAVEAASGEYIVKFDDDDFYGIDHVWDLVLAREYSGASLVGKGAEFVYLAGADRTIRRFLARAETFTTTIGGGALLIGRADLRSVGGWQRVPRQVDRALVADVERAGAAVYRTHGFGYILNRHGEGHTWTEADQYFLDQAEDSRAGFDPDYAGVDTVTGE